MDQSGTLIFMFLNHTWSAMVLFAGWISPVP